MTTSMGKERKGIAHKRPKRQNDTTLLVTQQSQQLFFSVKCTCAAHPLLNDGNMLHNDIREVNRNGKYPDDGWKQKNREN